MSWSLSPISGAVSFAALISQVTAAPTSSKSLRKRFEWEGHAGVVIGPIVAALILMFLVYFLYRYCKNRKERRYIKTRGRAIQGDWPRSPQPSSPGEMKDSPSRPTIISPSQPVTRMKSPLGTVTTMSSVGSGSTQAGITHFGLHPNDRGERARDGATEMLDTSQTFTADTPPTPQPRSPKSIETNSAKPRAAELSTSHRRDISFELPAEQMEAVELDAKPSQLSRQHHHMREASNVASLSKVEMGRGKLL